MFTFKQYKYSKLFVFEAHLIHIPASLNRAGTDPLPRFFVRPTVLKEVLDYTSNPTSVAGGYVKNKPLGYYIKNIDTIDVDQTKAQFESIKNMPPYGYLNEETYQSFVEVTFNATYSSMLQEIFSNMSPKYSVQAGTDAQISVAYNYVKMTDSTTQTFQTKKIKEIAKPKGLIVYDTLSVNT